MYRDPERNFDRAPLEADHSRSRSLHGTASNPADRLLHRQCNRERGDGTRDHKRPALTSSVPAAAGSYALRWPPLPPEISDPPMGA